MNTISIILNGKRQEVRPGSSINDLLPVVGAELKQVAVVVNAAVVSPDRRGGFILNDNDEVDILIFAGGG
jgi:sulfur carrier protein